MISNNKYIAAQILCEAAIDITNGNTYSCDDTATVALEAASIVTKTNVPAVSSKKKAKAKKAIIVTKEEIHDVVVYLNSVKSKIKDILRTSRYKKYIDGDVITMLNKFNDASKEFTEENEDLPFELSYGLFGIDLVKLAEAEEVSKDNKKPFMKSEAEAIAKLCDSVDPIIDKYKFLKKNFEVVLVYNKDKTYIACVLDPKKELVLNTSKYLED